MTVVQRKINASVFCYLLQAFGPEVALSKWTGSPMPAPAAVTAKTTDEDFDLFGDETAEDQQAQEKLAAKAAEKKPEKKTKVVINKSTLVIEVKPNNIDTNLDDVAKAVREIKMEGLEWSIAMKKVPIAFGLSKLQLGCVIIDDLVATDDILEKIECIGMNEEQAKIHIKMRDEGADYDDEEEPAGWVQSAEIVSFQKL